MQLRLLELGFSLSGQTLRLLGYPPYEPEPASPSVPEEPADLAPQLHAFAERIGTAIEAAAGNAAQSIETARLEELQYRARSLVLLLYGNKRPEARRYAAMLAESLTFLRPRLREQRWQWLGLWLAAQSVLAVAVAAGGEDPSALLAELQATDEKARRELLDSLAPYLAAGQGPWPELAAFVYGQDTALLSWAHTARQRQTAAAPALDGDPTEAEIRDALALLQPCYALYYGQRIPNKKLDNARRSCAAAPDESIVALLDCTVFGSAKEAVLFGTEHLYFCHSLGVGTQPGRLTYRELATRDLGASANAVYVGQGQSCCLIGSAVSGERLLGVLLKLGEVMRRR